jgi:hypothetical protein
MSKNILFVLMYHCHKLLYLLKGVKLSNQLSGNELFCWSKKNTGKHRFSWHRKLLLSPTSSLGGYVTGQWFHSVPWRDNANWGPLFHFPPASYIIRNFPASQLLSLPPVFTLVSQLIRPWRWRRSRPLKHRLTFNGLQSIIPQKTVLFITITAVRTSNPKFYSVLPFHSLYKVRTTLKS